MAKKYSHDMNNEREQDGFFEEGWHKWEVYKAVEAKSKGGNDMIILTLVEDRTFDNITVYAVMTPGKRWLLKSLLKACNVDASADGVYDWDIEDIKAKIVCGRVKNVKEEGWIDRNNVKHEGEWKSKVVGFKAVETDLGEEPEKP